MDNILNSPVPEPSRHERKCAVCRHPEREAIEEAFLHWQSPNQIAVEHDISQESSIYRHAHATGLFARRDNNLRFALGNFIERVDEIQDVKPEALVQAIRAYTRLSKTGEWVEPPRQIIVIHAKTSEDPISHVPVDVAGHVKAAHVPAGEADPDIMHIITPKPYSSRGAGNRSARVKKP